MRFFRRTRKTDGYASLDQAPYWLRLDRLRSDPEDPPTVSFLGAEVHRDEEDWLYCLIFPLLTEDQLDSPEWSEYLPHDIVQEKLELLFRACVTDNKDGDFDYLHIDKTFATAMTMRDFTEAVRYVVASLLAGHHMGFTLQAEPSIDEDELFLKVKLDEGKRVDVMHSDSWMPHLNTRRFNSLQQLADALSLRVPLDPDRYPRNMRCPTRDLATDRSFDGDAYIPAALSYSKERNKYFKKFSDFTDLDLIRLVRLRMNQFLNFDTLMEYGIIKPGGFFAVHRWRQVSMFQKRVHDCPQDFYEYPHGWARLGSIAQWPGDQQLHYVKEYFGEEIAFFFHWLNFFTSFLILPAFCGVVIGVLRFFPYFQTPKIETGMEMFFMGLMILWSSSFLEIYKRKMNFYIEAWGMRDYQVQEVERPSFKRERLGTMREDCFQMSHWFGIVVVIAWTVGVNYLISSTRAVFLKHPSHVWFGLPGSTLEKLAKYLVTINITVVDMIWGKFSTAMSKRENHRTPVELKDAMVLKLLTVKVFVYYYPFWYIAFAQKHIEGCNVGGTTCEEYLEQSLLVFVALHIGFVVFTALVSVLVTRCSIYRELRTVGGDYTYLQAQAKCPPYDQDFAISDFLELIASLGLVMQFSIIVPYIPFLQLLSNMIEVRLNAYRMVNIYQRVEGRGSEGIGSWCRSIYAITWLALVVNVGLGVFFMRPMKDWPLQRQLFTFLVVEHALIAMKVLVETFIPDIDTLTHMIMITNNSVVAKIFSGDKGSKVVVRGPAKVPDMSIKYDPEYALRPHTITHKGLVAHPQAVEDEAPYLAAPPARSCADDQSVMACMFRNRGGGRRTSSSQSLDGAQSAYAQQANGHAL